MDLAVDESFEISLSTDAGFSLPCPVSYNGLTDVTKDSCSESNCIWSSEATDEQCSLPSNDQLGFVVDGPREETATGFKLPLKKIGPTLFGEPIEYVTFEIFQLDNQILRFKVM